MGTSLERIPKAEAPSLNESEAVFSLKYLDLSSRPKFHINQCTAEFLGAFLSSLREMSRLRVCDACEYDNTRSSHHIAWEQTSEPNGFEGLLDEQLEPEHFWQFALDSKTPWRIHGFWIDSTFFVVWLDPNHSLYPINSGR